MARYLRPCPRSSLNGSTCVTLMDLRSALTGMVTPDSMSSHVRGDRPRSLATSGTSPDPNRSRRMTQRRSARVALIGVCSLGILTRFMPVLPSREWAWKGYFSRSAGSMWEARATEAQAFSTTDGLATGRKAQICTSLFRLRRAGFLPGSCASLVRPPVWDSSPSPPAPTSPSLLCPVGCCDDAAARAGPNARSEGMLKLSDPARGGIGSDREMS
jgi:hypothetical protein